MGPPSRRKTRNRKCRNWTHLGFLFTFMLTLLVSIQGNNVKAQQPNQVSATTVRPNTSTTTSAPNSNISTSTTIIGLKDTGEYKITSNLLFIITFL